MTKTLVSREPVRSPPHFYTLRNAHNMCVKISDHGAALLSWWAPDRYGHMADVLLGYADAQAYANNAAYFGAVVGRWANRIAGSRFSLDGVDYLVDCNDGTHHLHGGAHGFHRARWQVQQQGDERLRLTLESPDGAGGFPGNMRVEISYQLGDEGALTIEYQAISDAPTPINLTSHPYFNLNGGSSDIGDHILTIHADHYLKADASFIPFAKETVAGSAFDFREPAPIGARMGWPDPQRALTHGFNHCYCLGSKDDTAKTPLRFAARVYEPGTGRQLTVETTETGLQFYTGHFLEGVKGRNVQPYGTQDGFCLEAHAYPNQINGPDAEAVILRPGKVYRQTTVYRLSVLD